MDFTHEALKMAGALALVVVVLLAGMAWVRKTFGELPGQDGGPVMRVLGGLRLGAGKHIMLVEVASEVLVLGTTAKEMTLLTKITDEASVHRMRSLTDPVAGRLGAWIGQWKQAAPTPDIPQSLPKSQP